MLIAKYKPDLNVQTHSHPLYTVIHKLYILILFLLPLCVIISYLLFRIFSDIFHWRWAQEARKLWPWGEIKFYQTKYVLYIYIYVCTYVNRYAWCSCNLVGLCISEIVIACQKSCLSLYKIEGDIPPPPIHHLLLFLLQFPLLFPLLPHSHIIRRVIPQFHAIFIFLALTSPFSFISLLQSTLHSSSFSPIHPPPPTLPPSPPYYSANPQVPLHYLQHKICHPN